MKQNAKHTVFLRGKTIKFKKILLIFTLLLLVSTQLSASVGWQKNVITIKEKNIDLHDLIFKMGEEMDATFIFNYDDLDDFTKLNVDKSGTIEEILDFLLKDKGLIYTVNKNSYVIRKVEKKADQKQASEKQKEKELKGTVTDKDGNTLPGVSVVVKGTTTGVATDIDGNYTVQFDNDKAVLVFSFVGMISQEIAYTDQSILNIVLLEDSEQVCEVVVTGYQTIKKGRATGSFQIVNNEDLNNVASLDLTQKLEGVAAGVKVNRNGDILIRGRATLSAESKPLIVVDGFPWMESLSEINTDDIKQLTVLKDAASTSIYGVRGANGVIVITTKRGKKDSKLNVSYTNSYQISEKPDVEDLDLLSSKEHVELEWDVYKSVGLASYPWENYKSEVGEVYASLQSGTITEEQAMSQLDVLKAYDNQSDIEKYFFQREMTQKHTLSFDFGNDKNQFYASLSYDENKAKWKGTEGENFSFTMNDDFKFNNLFALHLNVHGNYRKNKSNGQWASMTRPYVRFLDDEGNYLDEAHGSWDKATVARYESQGLLDFSYNQLQEQRLKDNETKSNNISSNISFDITPIEGVKLTTSVGYNVLNSKNENFQNKESYAVRSYVNRLTDMNLNRVMPYGNILRYSNSNSENLTLRTQLSVRKEIKDFKFNLNAGVERNTFKASSNLNNTRVNYDPQRLTESIVDWTKLSQGYMNYAFGWAMDWNVPTVMETEDRYLSSYFIGGITFKDKYDLFGSWRLDKTNLFGQSSKYRDQPAWSVGAKWNLADEDFFDVSFINRLSIKASYGLSGNVEKNTSPHLIARPLNDYYTSAPALRVSNPENPLLGWEKSYTTNIGIDFALFNSKINGTIEYYNKDTKDVLAPVNVDPTTGFGGEPWSSFSMNNGEILNRGIDVNVHANIVNNLNFRYDVNLNFSYNYNKVISVDKPATTRSELIYGKTVVGKPIDYIYGYRNAGLDSEGEPMVYNRNGEKISWKDMSSLEIEDGKFFGRISPPVFGSLTNSFTYGNFTADVFITYDFGHKVVMYASPNPISNLSDKNILNIVNDRWKKAGDEARTSIPKLDNTVYSAQDRKVAVWQSDYSIDDADLIRLKSINLTYDFTPHLKTKTIKGLKLRAGIENIWHWTAARNGKLYDNKVAAVDNRGQVNQMQYVRGFYFPEYKKFTFGLTVQF